MKKFFIISISLLMFSNVCYSKDAYLEDKEDIFKFYNFLEVAIRDLGVAAPGQEELSFYELQQELIAADTKSGGRPVLLIYDEKYNPSKGEIFGRFDLKNPKEQFQDARFVKTQLFVTTDKIGKKIAMPEIGEETSFDYTDINRDKLLFLYVTEKDKKDVILSLIESGANINFRNYNGITVLMRAASLNTNPEIIRLLLDKGARINDLDVYGRDALIYAGLKNPNNEIAKELIRSGANKKHRDMNNLGFMDYARFNIKMQEAYKKKSQ